MLVLLCSHSQNDFNISYILPLYHHVCLFYRSEDEWDDPPPIEEEGMGVPVRALYTYNAVEDDELSFKSGDVFAKLSEEDAQGWCRGRINGKTGLYPANYVESV